MTETRTHRGMSPWFQSMHLILQFDISLKTNTQIEKELMATMEVGLAYRDNTVSEWTKMVRSFEQRKLNCNFIEAKIPEKEGLYECDLLPFMEMSGVAHKYYLLNIRLPVNEHKRINTGIGHVNDIYLVAIHQNGLFTKMWFSMKTFFTPIIIIALVWYWRRIMVMSRAPLLLEKAILALGISMTFINIPVEWFCVGFSWMALLVDVRQDIFYCMLLSFWIIFCGEHIMDKTKRNRLSVYWKQVGLVVFGCLCLLIFHIYERVIQLSHPVKSIWTSDGGAELSIAFITASGAGACLYFLFLIGFMVLPGFCCTSSKKVSLPDKSTDGCLWYKGLRFFVLVLVTVICAALTVIFFIISQVIKLYLVYWGEFTVQVNSAFFTGIYSMWNLYVLAAMFLYAPFHEAHGDAQLTVDEICSKDNLEESENALQKTPPEEEDF
ncbi:protein wntless homolog isoform X2 [Cheilinus undulatus]|uniref:protein wntless homolog isoform X2 n=1 Tax=Cheilinus undulatus TaxID=241271 RepID=UPI001BD3E419|nr:protein wntless homolog isoform X2 [Cheilinus undulatus]